MFWKKPLNEEKATFTLFDPFLTSQVKNMGENKDWCFGFRQVIRPTMPWYACFKKQETAQRCYQKVSRLQRHLRQKKPKGELYRPGEIVELHYIKEGRIPEPGHFPGSLFSAQNKESTSFTREKRSRELASEK